MPISMNLTVAEEDNQLPILEGVLIESCLRARTHSLTLNYWLTEI